MIVTLTDIVGLLIAAIAVALLAQRLRLPYTVGLVVAGVGLALSRNGGGVALTHDLVFDLILPPLLAPHQVVIVPIGRGDQAEQVLPPAMDLA